MGQSCAQNSLASSKEQVAGAWSSWLHQVLRLDRLRHLPVDIPEHHLELCAIGAANGVCEHIRSFGGDLKKFFGGGVSQNRRWYEDLVKVFVALRQAQWVCGAAARWKREVAIVIAEAIDEAVADRPCSDPLDIKHLRAKSKKRRTDIDFEMAVVRRLQVESRASSSASFARARNDISDKTATCFDEASLRWHISSGWMSFVSCQRFALAFDASRLGEPAEETEVYALWSPCNGKAIYLAPQAPKHGVLCRSPLS